MTTRVRHSQEELIHDLSTLRESENRLRLIFNSAVNAMIQLNDKGEIVDINDPGLELLAEKKTNVVGQDILALDCFFTKASLALIIKKIDLLAQGRGVKPSVVEATDKAGRQLFFELSARALKDQDNNPTGALLVLHDITENLIFAEKIKEKNQELERLYQIKSDFTTSVTHELRTPLTPLKESVRLILEGAMGPVNEQQKHLLALAKRNIDRLHRIINNVLDFDKLEKNKMAFNIKANDLVHVIKDCVESFGSVANEKGLYLKTDLPAALPTFFFDADRITQTIFNLLDNALKFTEKGGITITLVHQESPQMVKVCVADTGTGFSTQEQEKIFEKYVQLSNKARGKNSGTGLGLAICQDIIKHHGGKIWAASRPGLGSQFYFTLPTNR